MQALRGSRPIGRTQPGSTWTPPLRQASRPPDARRGARDRDGQSRRTAITRMVTTAAPLSPGPVPHRDRRHPESWRSAGLSVGWSTRTRRWGPLGPQPPQREPDQSPRCLVHSARRAPRAVRRCETPQPSARRRRCPRARARPSRPAPRLRATAAAPAPGRRGVAPGDGQGDGAPPRRGGWGSPPLVRAPGRRRPSRSRSSRAASRRCTAAASARRPVSRRARPATRRATAEPEAGLIAAGERGGGRGTPGDGPHRAAQGRAEAAVDRERRRIGAQG